MTVLDATALIGFLVGEPSAGQVEDILRSGDAVIPAVNLAEVFDHLERRAGRLPAEIAPLVDNLIQGALTVIAVEEVDGRLAGHLRAVHYHRLAAPVSMADCVALAAAMSLKARLATSDGALARVAQSRAVEVISLPNSAGQRP